MTVLAPGVEDAHSRVNLHPFSHVTSESGYRATLRSLVVTFAAKSPTYSYLDIVGVRLLPLRPQSLERRFLA